MHIYIHEAAVDCGLETIMKERNLQSFNLARIEATSKIESLFIPRGNCCVTAGDKETRNKQHS